MSNATQSSPLGSLLRFRRPSLSRVLLRLLTPHHGGQRNTDALMYVADPLSAAHTRTNQA
jgi:hypothetical protein